MSNMCCVSYIYLPLSFQGRTYNLLSPKNYSEVCKNCNDAYKNLSTLYNELQKMNGLENKAEPGTHLCIDVEDAVSTYVWHGSRFAVVGCTYSVFVSLGVCWNMHGVFNQRNCGSYKVWICIKPGWPLTRLLVDELIWHVLILK